MVPSACKTPGPVDIREVMLEEALPMSIWVREMLYFLPSRESDLVSPVRADLVEVSESN